MILKKARAFALNAHGDQRYGDKPYSYHLDAVVELLQPYGEQAQLVGYLHDVVEDTETGLDTLEEEFGRFVADCVAILTDEDGDTRNEKKAKTYAKMQRVTGDLQIALIVKAADRLANLQACVDLKRVDKLEMYRQEHTDFVKAVYRKDLCEDLWERLSALIKTD